MPKYERKFADTADIELQMTKLWLDDSINDLDALKAKLQSYHDQLVKTQQETKDLQAKAAKMVSDYPDKFK
jgi:cell division protein FtsB